MATTTISSGQRNSALDLLRRAALRTWPALVLLALTIAMFWKVALSNQYTWLNGGDLSAQVLPFVAEETRQWRQGHFPIWDPHHWGGQSLLGQDQPGVLFPLNWLLWSAPLWHGHIALQIANWYFVLIHFFAALFCYLLARDLALSRFASISAGAIFALSGYMANIEWPQMLNGGMWGPLVLLFALRALNGRRPIFSMALSGAIAGFSFYGGHHQIPIYTLLCVAFLLGFYVLLRGLSLTRAILLGLVCVAFTVLIGAPQLLPSYEYWSRALRWVSSAAPVAFDDRVPYVVFDLFSLNPAVVLGLFVPSVFPGITPFVGLTALSFGILAVTAPMRSRMAAPFAALAIFGILYSLGRYSVFHGMLYGLLPFLDKSRNAAFAMYIADLALAVLAAFGIDDFLQHRDAIRGQLRRYGQVLLAGAALLVLFLLARGVFEGAKMLDYPPAAQMSLSATLLACVFFAWALDRMPARGAMLSVLGLILFEIGMVTTVNYRHIELGWPYLAKLSEFDDIADFLRAQPGTFRIYTSGDDVGFNFGDWYGFDEYGGLGAGMTENMATMNGADGSYRMLGVAYFIGRQPFRSQAEPLFRGRTGINVYPMPDPFPRAWIVHTVESKSDPRQRQAYLNVPTDQLRNWTFVISPAPQVSQCSGTDSARVTRISATHLDVEADLACPGMLIAGNVDFPGWRARVDGSRTRIWEAYSFLQGVVVPAGHHSIHFHYVPVSLYIGLALTALGLAALVLLARARIP